MGYLSDHGWEKVIKVIEHSYGPSGDATCVFKKELRETMKARSTESEIKKR